MELSPFDPGLLRIITATDGDGTNCHHRALAALGLCRESRAVIGTLLLRGCRCLRTGEPMPWAKPWHHHIWLREPDGAYYDPSASNLEHWAREVEVELPGPWEQLAAGVIESRDDQRELVSLAITGRPALGDLPPAIYLPGFVYASSTEESPPSPGYVAAWGQLARECEAAGGWDAAQLEAALGRVEGLMAKTACLRATAVRSARPCNRRPRRSAQGFGRGVA